MSEWMKDVDHLNPNYLIVMTEMLHLSCYARLMLFRWHEASNSNYRKTGEFQALETWWHELDSDRKKHILDTTARFSRQSLGLPDAGNT